MKTLIDAIRLIAISVIAGLLLFWGQVEYEKRETRNAITVQAFAGPWAPHPLDVENGAEYDLGAAKKYIRGRNNFAQIEIRNDGAQELNNARLSLIDFDFDIDILVVNPDDNTSYYYESPESVELPIVKPGNRLSIYVWSYVEFGWPSFMDDLALYTPHGKFPITSHSHVTRHGYGDENKGDDTFFGVILNKWPWLLVGLSLLLALLTIIADRMTTSYIKKVVASYDFWLIENRRMKSIGRKKFVANLEGLDKEYDHELKQ